MELKKKGTQNAVKFGKFIRKKRLMADFTQRELAKRVGVSSQEVCLYEKGLRTPKLIHALRIFKTLDIELDEIPFV